jgi:hypothetical protein
MITYRKRLKRSLREENRDIVNRTWLLFITQGRGKERVLERRVTMIEVHHSHGRRIT